MFNLIVRGNGWAEGRDNMYGSRIFEYTEQNLIDRFKPGGQLDLVSLATLPTLFLEETAGQGDQIARVGKITEARMSGRDVALEYFYYPDIPAITNSVLQGCAADLDVADFQFSRTHWSIKDVDLFRVLLRNLQPRRNRPKVFHVEDPERIEPSLNNGEGLDALSAILQPRLALLA